MSIPIPNISHSLMTKVSIVGNRYKYRMKHLLIKIKGENDFGDLKEAEKFSPKLKNIIVDGKYSPDQDINEDKTGIFWKKNGDKIICDHIANMYWWI